MIFEWDFHQVCPCFIAQAAALREKKRRREEYNSRSRVMQSERMVSPYGAIRNYLTLFNASSTRFVKVIIRKYVPSVISCGDWLKSNNVRHEFYCVPAFFLTASRSNASYRDMHFKLIQYTLESKGVRTLRGPR